MGISDQFKDKAQELADQAKQKARKGKEGSPERRTPQGTPERRPQGMPDPDRERMEEERRADEARRKFDQDYDV
ncbi:hypothetical protein [Streptomyces sp. SYSU K217416]